LEHALYLNDAIAAPDIAIARETREFYRMTESRAVEIIREVEGAVSTWHGVARDFGIQRDERQRFGDLVFEAPELG
jgi:hypothetical protein